MASRVKAGQARDQEISAERVEDGRQSRLLRRAAEAEVERRERGASPDPYGDEPAKAFRVTVEGDEVVVRMSRPTYACGVCGVDALADSRMQELVDVGSRDSVAWQFFEHSLRQFLFNSRRWGQQGPWERSRRVWVGGEDVDVCAACSGELNAAETAFREEQGRRAQLYVETEREHLGRLVEKVCLARVRGDETP